MPLLKNGRKIYRRAARSVVLSLYVLTLPISLPLMMVAYKSRGKSIRPRLLEALKLSKHSQIEETKRYLWYGCEVEASAAAHRLLKEMRRDSNDYANLATGLASRLEFDGKPDEALCAVEKIEMTRLSYHNLIKVAIFKSALHQKYRGKAVTEALLKRHPELVKSSDFSMIHANDYLDAEAKLGVLRSLYEAPGLVPIKLSRSGNKKPILSLVTDTADEAGFDVGKVSVIFPVYNAESTIETAVESILAQTYRNVELVLVDDCSTDGTSEKLTTLTESDSRITVSRMPHNSGAYAARNHGLGISRGDFITTHDSDDWSHPQKLELQLRPFLSKSSLVATGSYWVRATPDLYFCSWNLRESLIHRSYPSYLVRRRVFDEIGHWDEVRISGDSEFIHRVRRTYGSKSVSWVHPETPLAISLMDEGSLTGAKATHVSSTKLGLRYYYLQAIRYQASSGRGSERERQEERRRLIPPELLSRDNRDHIRYEAVVEADFRFKDMVDAARAICEGASGLVGLSHRPEFVVDPVESFHLSREFFDLVRKSGIEIVNDPDLATCERRHRLKLNGADHKVFGRR